MGIASRILVTGATGQIGREVVGQLRAAGRPEFARRSSTVETWRASDGPLVSVVRRTRVQRSSRSADKLIVFWWFKRGNQYVRYESRELAPRAFELRFVDADGSERVETFDDARRLEERQRDLERTLTKDGWTGPHGWNL